MRFSSAFGGLSSESNMGVLGLAECVITNSPFALLGVRVAKLIRLNTFVVLQPGIHLFQKQKAKSGLR